MKALARAVTWTLIAAVIAMSLSVTWTTGLFWWTMLGCAAVGLGILTVKFIQAGREIDAFLDSDSEPHPYDDSCCLDECTRPGVVPFNTTGGVLFACRQCAGIVGQWVGQVYDQTLDQATDLGQWNKEMDAS